MRKTSIVFLLALLLTPLLNTSKVFAAENTNSITLYDDSLSSKVSNWSWNSNLNFDNSNPVTSGSRSVKFLPGKYGAFYVHMKDTVNASDLDHIGFSVFATSSSQKFKLIIYGSDNKSLKSVELGSPSVNAWKKYIVKASDIGLSGKSISGFAIQEAAGISDVKSYIDNMYLILTSAPSTVTPSPTPSPTPTPTPTPAPNPTPTPTPTSGSPISGSGYTVSNGKIYRNGSAVTLKGVNWFGFEEKSYTVHGLWSRNWKDMISQMKSLGFNAVRIPVCPTTLQGVTPTSIDYSLNPDLKGLNSLQILDKVVNELSNNQMHVLIDHHRPDCTAISELWNTSSYSESQWIGDLKTIANRYKNVPYFLGVDLKNEPHGKATWNANSSTDWNSAAERAGQAILSVDPNILIFVEGIQENPNCSDSYGHWMGGNLNPFNCKAISTTSIPANKLVLSPHVYGPSVYPQSYFSASDFPNNMPTIWDKHFGSLVQKGYTIVPGEWGGKYGTDGNTKDKVWQDAMKNYFKANGICSSFYWSWNPNSGDTGGILQDDWKTPWSSKMSMLNDYYSTCTK